MTIQQDYDDMKALAEKYQAEAAAAQKQLAELRYAAMQVELQLKKHTDEWIYVPPFDGLRLKLFALAKEIGET